MTKVKGGIESMLSGKFGNMVFVQSYGKTYMRSAPKRKKDASTPAMLLNQKRFGEVIRFCSEFKSTVIPQIWNLAAVGTSGYRLFQKTNSPAFAKDGSLMDPKLIRLSTGKLILPQGFTAGKPELGGSVIEVSWQEDLHLGGIHLQDELMVISSGDGQYSDIKATGILRGNLNGSFELPELSAPATHVYLFFASKDRRDYSESICFEV
jgi:hypothetical protein